MIDAPIVKVHRHGQGAKGGLKARRSAVRRGGMTTKILALTDALGNDAPLAHERYDLVRISVVGRFFVTSGHRMLKAEVRPFEVLLDCLTPFIGAAGL